MVDLLRDAGDNKRLNTIFSAIAAVGVMIMMLTVLVGWLAAGPTDRNDIKYLSTRLDALSVQVGRVSDQLASGLRPDEVNRHLSSQDGRMDAIDTRMRNDEERLTRALTLLEEIDASSRATASQIRKSQP